MSKGRFDLTGFVLFLAFVALIVIAFLIPGPKNKPSAPCCSADTCAREGHHR